MFSFACDHYDKCSSLNSFFFLYSRVKFRYDVEVKEFSRAAHEFEDAEWAKDLEYSGLLPVFLTCVFCIGITVLLPWYVIGSNV